MFVNGQGNVDASVMSANGQENVEKSVVNARDQVNSETSEVNEIGKNNVGASMVSANGQGGSETSMDSASGNGNEEASMESPSGQGTTDKTRSSASSKTTVIAPQRMCRGPVMESLLLTTGGGKTNNVENGTELRSKTSGRLLKPTEKKIQSTSQGILFLFSDIGAKTEQQITKHIVSSKTNPGWRVVLEQIINAVTNLPEDTEECNYVTQQEFDSVRELMMCRSTERCPGATIHQQFMEAIRRKDVIQLSSSTARKIQTGSAAYFASIARTVRHIKDRIPGKNQDAVDKKFGILRKEIIGNMLGYQPSRIVRNRQMYSAEEEILVKQEVANMKNAAKRGSVVCAVVDAFGDDGLMLLPGIEWSKIYDMNDACVPEFIEDLNSCIADLDKQIDWQEVRGRYGFPQTRQHPRIDNHQPSIVDYDLSTSSDDSEPPSPTPGATSKRRRLSEI
jgi:hypothetical protein